ncbi:uncharacterized protein LOC122520955 [Polistes fuscatus]|uniref:uncharacterized protein LOC122520955 n=1 Tax=Polistes fuscatus TaxID=30207 RepID=UPI001CAA2A97|nr:uncharacterized protein LOC122520955 [Polistes fuscatus]
MTAAALLQVGFGGHVAVRMPYLNPAGVTYINNVPEESSLAYAASYQTQQHFGSPLQYAAPLQYAQAAVPAKVEAHHVGYATAQVPAVAAVPYVKHIPTVSHVPVTRIEAQPAVFEKQLDVIKPAVSTRKVEVRRPAIQKQFYDIEERVIIRPAGSAVVELDEPTSKSQKGPAVIQPLAYNHVSVGQSPVQVPILSHSVGPAPIFAPSSTPAPATISSTPSSISEEESVVVDNPEFRNANSPQNGQRFFASEPQVITRSNGAPFEENSPFIAHDPSPSVVPSQRLNAEENKSNQNRLIELLTARGSVSEVGFGARAGVDLSRQNIEAGHVRARVLSATPAPDDAEPTDQRVSTRRVVVSRPIETLQEVDVVEPATKLERVSIRQPTLIKTARLDHVQVHGSVPVVGKAYAPAVAHAAVPVYQKTISPAYEYYH